MNKSKKSDPKKFLVRNTERPVPKTKLVSEDDRQHQEKKKSTVKDNKNELEDKGIKFQTPEPNSVLQIPKKIDQIENIKSCKIQSAPNIAFSEKMTRKVNFPSDQAIFKDLIPLQVSAKCPSIPSSREPLPLKDKEPTLSSFAKPEKGKEFVYEPSLRVDNQPIQPYLNNLRLYKILQIHE